MLPGDGLGELHELVTLALLHAVASMERCVFVNLVIDNRTMRRQPLLQPAYVFGRNKMLQVLENMACAVGCQDALATLIVVASAVNGHPSEELFVEASVRPNGVFYHANSYGIWPNAAETARDVDAICELPHGVEKMLRCRQRGHVLSEVTASYALVRTRPVEYLLLVWPPWSDGQLGHARQL
jgi:hypothetical protein